MSLEYFMCSEKDTNGESGGSCLETGAAGVAPQARGTPDNTPRLSASFSDMSGVVARRTSTESSTLCLIDLFNSASEPIKTVTAAKPDSKPTSKQPTSGRRARASRAALASKISVTDDAAGALAAPAPAPAKPKAAPKPKREIPGKAPLSASAMASVDIADTIKQFLSPRPLPDSSAVSENATDPATDMGLPPLISLVLPPGSGGSGPAKPRAARKPRSTKASRAAVAQDTSPLPELPALPSPPYPDYPTGADAEDHVSFGCGSCGAADLALQLIVPLLPLPPPIPAAEAELEAAAIAVAYAFKSKVHVNASAEDLSMPLSMDVTPVPAPALKEPEESSEPLEMEAGESPVAKGFKVGTSSAFRGVTRHCHTQRYESHLWDNTVERKNAKSGRLRGRQVYLGGFATEIDASRAYDRASLVFFGPDRATLNHPLADYTSELPFLSQLSKETVVQWLRTYSACKSNNQGVGSGKAKAGAGGGASTDGTKKRKKATETSGSGSGGPDAGSAAAANAAQAPGRSSPVVASAEGGAASAAAALHPVKKLKKLTVRLPVAAVNASGSDAAPKARLHLHIPDTAADGAPTDPLRPLWDLDRHPGAKAQSPGLHNLPDALALGFSLGIGVGLQLTSGGPGGCGGLERLNSEALMEGRPRSPSVMPHGGAAGLWEGLVEDGYGSNWLHPLSDSLPDSTGRHSWEAGLPEGW